MSTRRILGTAATLATTATLALGAGAGGGSSAAPAAAAAPSTTFSMLRSTAAVGAGCLTGARATVTITPIEGAERMVVRATGLPANTGFDLFVLQTPDAPFGMSWYQGDLESGALGNATGTFVGRFNEETFSVAPGTAPAPVKHWTPIRDASSNPATAPLHQYHLGLWFNSPAGAVRAGCPGAVTPFNGEHDAGVQALSTRQFPVQAGPLSRVPS